MKSIKTLVIGASTNPSRYSNMAVNRLLEKGHEVKAIGLRQGKINNIEIDTNLIPHKDVNTITLYLNPVNQKEYYGYIISLKPKRVIFNPGTENPELYELLKKNNISFEVACTLVMLATDQF